MGVNSRRYFSMHFSLDACARKYEGIFTGEVGKRLSR